MRSVQAEEWSALTNGELQAGAILGVESDDREGAVLVQELDGASVIDWDTFRNRSFARGLRVTGIPVNAVVPVLPFSLPRLPDGRTDVSSLVSDFADQRGFLAHELEAWTVNQLCGVLFLTPERFDRHADWARHGVDSAVLLELLGDFEDRFSVRLPQSMSKCRNVVQLAHGASVELIGAGMLPWWRSPITVARSI